MVDEKFVRFTRIIIIVRIGRIWPISLKFILLNVEKSRYLEIGNRESIKNFIVEEFGNLGLGQRFTFPEWEIGREDKRINGMGRSPKLRSFDRW